jgi:hypothetical protein
MSFTKPQTKPMNPPPIPNPIPQRPAIAGRFAFEPMPAGKSPILMIEALLKYPGRIIHELQHNWRVELSSWLLVLALLGMALYGVVVGSFSGGPQMWIAPAKLALGTLLSVLICLPSLYIFACLGGIDARLRTVTGVLFAAVGLGALLLIGFAPVAWIFSQSTDSVAFMGALHLMLWGIGISFGLRLIEAMGRLLTGSARSHLKLWGLIFVVVCLQMMTTLRPIIASSKTFFPTEKKFFLANWFDSLNGPAAEKKKTDD